MVIYNTKYCLNSVKIFKKINTVLISCNHKILRVLLCNIRNKGTTNNNYSEFVVKFLFEKILICFLNINIVQNIINISY